MPSKSAALAAYASIKGSEPEAGVIDLSYFTRENGVPMTAGYYAVIYGHFASKAEATAATARYPKSADRYARYTQPK
jgi:septal ring-binding cell division protein DamX